MEECIDAVENVFRLQGEGKGPAPGILGLEAPVKKSDVCATCRPACEFFVHQGDVLPGTFIAAVGADNEHKQEIDPELMASYKLVVDGLEQCPLGFIRAASWTLLASWLNGATRLMA